jgi:alginate O-acetyltransferase complex protein AlgI
MGCSLVLERLFLGKWLAKMGKVSFVYTFIVVLIGWVFFRLEDMRLAAAYLGRMFVWAPSPALWQPDGQQLTMLIVAAFFSFFVLPAAGQRLQHKVYDAGLSKRGQWAMAGVAVMLLALCTARITASTFNPFIYFRF